MPQPSEISTGSFAGVTGAVRSGSPAYFEILRHFEITTDPFKLTPHKSMVSDNDASRKPVQLVYASDGNLYGRGVDTSAGTKIQIYIKDPEITGSWADVTGGVSTSNLSFRGCFKDFDNYIIGVATNGNVFRWGDFTGTPSFTEAWQSLSSTPSNVSQGIIGPDKDFYFGWNNKVALVASGFSFDEDNFIAPSNLVVRSLENYGNFLAIGCSGDGISSGSECFLWNQVDADPSVRIDFGLEVLWHIGIIDGGLYAFMLSHNSTLTENQKLIVKRWRGGGEQGVETMEIVDLGGTGFSMLPEKFTENNRVYFALNKNDDADEKKGIWSYGRPNSQYPFGLVQEIKGNNDTLITTINSFYKLADYWWMGFDSDGSLTRTNNSGLYSATSVARTCIFSGKRSSTKKQIIGIEVSFEPLPANGQVTVKFAANGGSFETVLTESADNETYASATKLSDGSSFDICNYWQWQFESTGGAVITGYRFLYNEPVKGGID